eukprot:g15058.t1
MRLRVDEGQLYLTPSDEQPIGTVERAYDFSVLPAVVEQLGEKQRHEGRLISSDGLCYQFSQLLNGRPVKELLNAKDSRDIDYVVTAVEVQKGQVYRPSQYIGNNILLRWGEGVAPEFVSDAELREEEERKTVKQECWYARLFYEVTHDAHEKLQLFTEGAKSSAIEIDEKDAEKIGFQSYFIPSVRGEVKAVVGHGIFGRTAKRKEITAKNVITSRLVVVIKIDIGTGLVSRIKSRWVSRGFEDRRFGKKNSKGAGLNCRSHTMSDASYLFLMQFCQSMSANVWYGDIEEAFLKGMKFLESYGDEYHADPNSEVWMTVPKVIQQMKEFKLGEVVELLASIYGCKDAPLNWQRTFHAALKALRLTQSQIDPCLWMVYATPRERQVIAEGKTDEYYWEQVEKMKSLDSDDLAGCAEIICGGEQPAPPAVGTVLTDGNFLNPATEQLAEALTMHHQGDGKLLGAIGSHVDDTVSGGHKLFMLRLLALFRKFPLGSFCKLAPGTRDNFIGRENHCVPAVIEQYQLNKVLDEHAEQFAETDAQAQSFRQPIDEAKIAAAEQKYGIQRDQDASTYPTAPAVACTAENLFHGAEMDEEMAFIVSQEGYARKLKTIEQNEVEQFIVERNRARNKWQRKQMNNPFRGRIGELIWLTKTNGIIAEGVSQLAGQLLQAEQAPDWESVQFFVNDLNGLIGLAQASGASCRRIRRLGNLFEHGLFGCGDAAKDRVGGTVNLAGPLDRRFSTMGQFSKLPKRVYNSSTGIETLAARMVNSEMLFAAQLAMDLQLIPVNKSFLQLVDNKNITQEPKEKSLRLDFYALQQLKGSGQLELVHIPGVLNWTDPLTKAIRSVVPELLYLASVWGVCDDRIEKLIAQFVKDNSNWREGKPAEEEEEVELRDLGVVAEGKENEVGSGFITTTSSTTEQEMRVSGSQDVWTEDDRTIVRHHLKPRATYFTPVTRECTKEDAEEHVLSFRQTKYLCVDTNEFGVIDDDWSIKIGKKNEHEPLFKDRRFWTGTTTWWKKIPGKRILNLRGPIKKSKKASAFTAVSTPTVRQNVPKEKPSSACAVTCADKFCQRDVVEENKEFGPSKNQLQDDCDRWAVTPTTWEYNHWEGKLTRPFDPVLKSRQPRNGGPSFNELGARRETVYYDVDGNKKNLVDYWKGHRMNKYNFPQEIFGCNSKCKILKTIYSKANGERYE